MPTTIPLREIVHLTEQLLVSRRPNDALRRCDVLLAANPHWLEIKRIKAEAMIALNQPVPALEIIDHLLACDPEMARAYVLRGWIMRQQNDLLGTLACLRRACELASNDEGLRNRHDELAVSLHRPPYSPSHTGLARMYVRSELYQHAVREWDTALRANPHRIDAQIGIAETFWCMGETKRAIPICLAILRTYPDCLKPLLLVAVDNLHQGQRDRAQAALFHASQLDPDMRAAGELFANQVAAGDTVLASWLRDAAKAVYNLLAPVITPNFTPRDTHPPAQSSAQPSPRTYLTDPLPQGKAPTGPLFATNRPNTSPLEPTSKLPPLTPQSMLGADQDGDFFSRSRTSMLPDDFQRIFDESRNILWRDDHQAENGQSTDPVDTHETTSEATDPPASKEELDYVRWLQSQGAQAIEEDPAERSVIQPVAPPPFLLDALRQSASPEQGIPALPPVIPLEVSAPSAPVSEPPQPLVHGNMEERAPLVPQPPTAQGTTAEGEAHLSTSVASERWAESEPAVPVALPPMVPPPRSDEGHEATRPPLPVADPLPPPDPDVAAPVSVWPAPPTTVEQQPANVWPGAPEPDEPVHPAAAAAPVTSLPAEQTLTIEAIEQGLSAIGFARHETGRLATVASLLHDAEPSPEVIDPDIHVRLARARQLRHAGQMSEALGEYRTAVKAQSDALPDVIRALMDAAIEHPQEPELQRLLGDAHIRMGNYVESLEAYNRASALGQEGS